MADEQQPKRETRPRTEGRGPRPEGGPGNRPDRGGERGGERRGDGRPGGDRFGDRRDAPLDIELEKLVADSLYLDNQAHAIVSRMRDMDSGTRTQLRRFYGAVRRAVRAPENERQHEFVMLRARLAYAMACAAWTNSKNFCSRSLARTTSADTNDLRTSSKPSWLITSKV